MALQFCEEIKLKDVDQAIRLLTKAGITPVKKQGKVNILTSLINQVKLNKNNNNYTTEEDDEDETSAFQYTAKNVEDHIKDTNTADEALYDRMRKVQEQRRKQESKSEH